MKRFLFSFLLFLTCSFAFAQENAPTNVVLDSHLTTESTSKTAESQKQIDVEGLLWVEKNLISPLSTAHKNAVNTPNNELSILENPEKYYNLFNLFYLPTRDTGILTGAKGLGDWAETEFGRFRLVSCYSGFKDSSVFLALEAHIHPEWKLKKPVLQDTKQADILSQEIFYPIQNVFAQKNEFYTKSMFFPMLYSFKNTETFFAEPVIQLSGCKNDVCLNETLSFSLKLNREKPLVTDICPAMINHLQRVPFPPQKESLKVDAFVQSNSLLQVNIGFSKSVDDVLLQIENDFNWQVLKKTVTKSKAQFLIKPDSKLNENDVLNLKILSSVGWFDAPTRLQSKAFLPEPVFLKKWDIFVAGLFFMVFSPLFLLFLSLHPKNRKELKTETNKIILATFVISLLLAFGLYFSESAKMIFDLPLVVYIFTIPFLCWLLYKPNFSLSLALVAFFVFPKPYFVDIVNQFQLYDWRVFVVLLVWAFMGAFVFLQTRRQFYLFFLLSRAKKSCDLFKRVIIGLLLALSLVSVFSMLMFKPTQNPVVVLNDAISTQKSVFVSVQQSPCFVCGLNRFLFKHSNATYTLYNSQNLLLISLNPATQEGQAFLNEFKLKAGNYSMLYSPDAPYGIQLEGYASEQKIIKSLKKALVIE